MIVARSTCSRIAVGAQAPRRPTKSTPSSKHKQPQCRSALPERSTVTEAENRSFLPSSALMAATMLTAFPAAAEEVAASDAATSGVLGLYGSTEGFALAISPLFVYGIFYAYRQFVNPRATISDLLFIIGALVVFGNIFSILVFKKRIY